jgi:hypothetical protein
MDLVIARYKEKIDWIQSIKSFFSNVYLYNKDELIQSEFIQKKLKNIGREANSYIHHIIDNYDNISEFTIFLQGEPYEHCPTLNHEIQNIERLRKIIKIKFFDISFNPDFYEFGDWLQINTAHDEFYHCLNQICDITKIQKFDFRNLRKNIWGAQFGVVDHQIKKYTKSQWQELLMLSEEIKEFPYAMEKFWSYLFT